MANLTLELQATAPQLEIVNCTAKRITLIAGRRWGKNTGVFHNRLIKRCLENKGFIYTYISPNYSQAKKEFRAIKHCKGLREVITHTEMQPFPRIVFCNGSEAQFRTWNNPEAFPGASMDECCLDESQDIKDPASFESIIMPMLADRRGTLLLMGQGRGQDWRYDKFIKPAQAGKKGYAFFQYPSWTGLAFQNKEGREELQAFKETMPSMIYRVQFGAEILANESAVFGDEYLAKCKQGQNLSQGVPGRRYIMGVDLGRVVDNTFIVVIDGDAGQVVYSEMRPLKEPHAVSARIVADIVRRFNNATCIVDVTGAWGQGGQGTSDEVSNVYLKAVPNLRRFTWDRIGKQNAVTNLAIAFEQSQIVIPAENDVLHAQLTCYEYIYRGHGRVEYGAPAGRHDDGVGALALAWQGKLRGWMPDTGGVSLAAGLRV
jgi:hypothetical protein